MVKATMVLICALCLIFVHQQASAASAPLLSQGSKAAQQSTVGGGRPELHVVEGRVGIKLNSHELTIGQYNKIYLDLHSYPVEQITADFGPTAEMAYLPDPDPDSGVLYLKRDRDGGTYVDVLPTRMGKFPWRLRVFFADGGLDVESTEVNVDRIADETPRRFILAYPAVTMDFTKKAGTLHLDLISQYSQELLIPVAFYKGVHPPIPLTPIPMAMRDDISYIVIPRKDQPSPVVYDPSTGEVKAVKLGQALIKVTLRGKSAYACVDVMRDVREWNDRSNCNDFLPPDLKEPIDEPMQTAKPVEPAPR